MQADQGWWYPTRSIRRHYMRAGRSLDCRSEGFTTKTSERTTADHGSSQPKPAGLPGPLARGYGSPRPGGIFDRR